MDAGAMGPNARNRVAQELRALHACHVASAEQLSREAADLLVPFLAAPATESRTTSERVLSPRAYRHEPRARKLVRARRQRDAALRALGRAREQLRTRAERTNMDDEYDLDLVRAFNIALRDIVLLKAELSDRTATLAGTSGALVQATHILQRTSADFARTRVALKAATRARDAARAGQASDGFQLRFRLEAVRIDAQRRADELMALKKVITPLQAELSEARGKLAAIQKLFSLPTPAPPALALIDVSAAEAAIETATTGTGAPTPAPTLSKPDETLPFASTDGEHSTKGGDEASTTPSSGDAPAQKIEAATTTTSTQQKKEKDTQWADSQALVTGDAAPMGASVDGKGEPGEDSSNEDDPAHVLAERAKTAAALAGDGLRLRPRKPLESQPSSLTRRRLPRPSAARTAWEAHKSGEGAASDSMDRAMDMLGLETAKAGLLRVKAGIDTARRQGVPLGRTRWHAAFVGNPGLDQEAFAREYIGFLHETGVLEGRKLEKVSASTLAADGREALRGALFNLGTFGGGILITDADALGAPGDHHGPSVLAFMLQRMAAREEVVFLLAAQPAGMRALYAADARIQGAMQHRFEFEDFTEEELLESLAEMADERFGGRIRVAAYGPQLAEPTSAHAEHSGQEAESDVQAFDPDGLLGCLGRVAIRRVARGRAQPGFRNRLTIVDLFGAIIARQAARLSASRLKTLGGPPDDFLFTREDVVGPAPADVRARSASYARLQGLLGLEEIKLTVENLFGLAQDNYRRELKEMKPHAISLNRVFLGPPGTGKTLVSFLYASILAELGLLSSGEVIVVNPTDFIGKYLGDSEANTRKILRSAIGKVLVIDEAYMLYPGKQDSYRTAVVDTLVSEIQPGEDRAVLLLGYEDKMMTMFRNVNPGMRRRFALEDAFVFKDYSVPELRLALEWKLREHEVTATPAALEVAMSSIVRARQRSNFGNIGEIENLLGRAKVRSQARQVALPWQERAPDAPLEPVDFEVDFERADHAADNLATLFADLVGCEEILAKLGTFQAVAQAAKARGRDPRDLVPMNFVFMGPPGTGKTTTARKMGQVYYDMGLLSSPEVLECSASDLVGEYVGQTGPKTRQLFESALSQVLLIDEAPRLAEGKFAKEAVDELVALLTHPTFKGKLLVVLAGYPAETNHLLAANPGLASRFPERVRFAGLSPERCMDVLVRELDAHGVQLPTVADSAAPGRVRLLELFARLSVLPSWGNVRDVQTLSKRLTIGAYSMPAAVDSTSDERQLCLSAEAVIDEVQHMLDDRASLSTEPAS